jgi:hypothetical protein
MKRAYVYAVPARKPEKLLQLPAQPIAIKPHPVPTIPPLPWLL